MRAGAARSLPSRPLTPARPQQPWAMAWLMRQPMSNETPLLTRGQSPRCSAREAVCSVKTMGSALALTLAPFFPRPFLLPLHRVRWWSVNPANFLVPVGSFPPSFTPHIVLESPKRAFFQKKTWHRVLKDMNPNPPFFPAANWVFVVERRSCVIDGQARGGRGGRRRANQAAD